MEIVRNRHIIKFVVNEKQAEQFKFQPNFKSFNIINQDLVSVHLTSTSILWNKLTTVGASILDNSKLILYKFHYCEKKPSYGDSLTVAYKDTDSLLYRIETDDLYIDMKNFAHPLVLRIMLLNGTTKFISTQFSAQNLPLLEKEVTKVVAERVPTVVFAVLISSKIKACSKLGYIFAALISCFGTDHKLLMLLGYRLFTFSLKPLFSKSNNFVGFLAKAIVHL